MLALVSCELTIIYDFIPTPLTCQTMENIKTILHEASLILAAKAVDEKPANTTE